MPISAAVKPNLYKDSVALMRVGEVALALAGVQRATLLMGTSGNKEMLDGLALLRDEFESARPSDLMIFVEAESEAACNAAHDEITRMLEGKAVAGSSPQADAHVSAPSSIALAAKRIDHADLAQISVPGPYAGAEAMKALKQGLHVFLFSDNVPLDQERALKELARRKNLLVMGPDCGTAILCGIPLGFANVVRRGRIGLVGASGTGLQEVTCRIHALGQGVSHAIGTGGRDVYDEVGGVTMRQAIDLLVADPETHVVVIVSKPPGPVVAREMLAHAERAGKPFVVLFLGAAEGTGLRSANVFAVSTLEEAAAAAVSFATTGRFDAHEIAVNPHSIVDAEAGKLAPSQRYIRGLYSGGTFCTEAQLVWGALGMRVQSNVPLKKDQVSADDSETGSHSAIDFGADEFTVGRPHPMIDMSTRIEQLGREARDLSVAVVVLDVVLGYGSHDDPAGALAPAIAQAQTVARTSGRHLSVVTFVCGTADDPQRLSTQQERLRSAGALVVESSTAAARLAGSIIAAVTMSDVPAMARSV